VTTGIDRARRQVATAGAVLRDNVAHLTLEEALFPAGGYRSVLGLLKHIGGWAHVYRSCAFDASPLRWEQTTWPFGLRDTVECTDEYLDAVIAWVEDALRDWDDALAPLDDAALDAPYPVHWHDTAPLAEIVTMVANHLTYHAGEINMLLSIARGEAWEYGEEVEENHIDTFGHGVRGPWMSDAIAAAYETKLQAAHDARIAER
jgi:uncharacterized damage-inducible protein DinB